MATKDSEKARHWCSRCRASVPLIEWKLSPTARSWKHVGPRRDGPDFFCDPDEDGNTECGFVEPIPTPIEQRKD